jgi:hypothetical protein
MLIIERKNMKHFNKVQSNKFQLLTEINPDKVDGYIEKFYQTWSLENLRNITHFVESHFEEKNSREQTIQIFYKFLLIIQKKKKIEEKVYSDELNRFALKLIPKIDALYSLPESLELKKFSETSHLCVNNALEISQRSKKPLDLKKLLDYINWQIKSLPQSNWYTENFYRLRVIAKTVKNTKSEIIHLPEFIVFFIANLCFFLNNTQDFRTLAELKDFTIFYLPNVKKVIKSSYLEIALDKLPNNLSQEDLTILEKLLLSDQKIIYRKLNMNHIAPIPLQHPCWNMLRQILENKIVPLILPREQETLDTITAPLSVILPLTIIQLVYQYYNHKTFIDVEVVEIVNKETTIQAFRLFHQKRQEGGNNPSLGSDKVLTIVL